MQDGWRGPSGSRWEPVAPPTVRTAPPATARTGGPEPRRRSRRPLIAALLAVLGAGAVTTGAAYAQGGTLTAPTPAGSTSQVSGPEGGPHGHDHHGPRP